MTKQRTRQNPSCTATSQQAGWVTFFWLTTCISQAEACELHLMRQLGTGSDHRLLGLTPRHRLEGQFKSYRFVKIGCVLQYKPLWTVWNREFLFHLILFEPQMLKQVAHESVNDVLELIPRFQFTDWWFNKLHLPLKADLNRMPSEPNLQSFGAASLGSSHPTCSTLKQNIQTYSDGLPQAQTTTGSWLRFKPTSGPGHQIGFDLAQPCRIVSTTCRLFLIQCRWLKTMWFGSGHTLQLLKLDQICRLQMAFSVTLYKNHLGRHFRQLEQVSKTSGEITNTPNCRNILRQQWWAQLSAKHQNTSTEEILIYIKRIKQILLAKDGSNCWRLEEGFGTIDGTSRDSPSLLAGLNRFGLGK